MAPFDSQAAMLGATNGDASIIFEEMPRGLVTRMIHAQVQANEVSSTFAVGAYAAAERAITNQIRLLNGAAQ